MKTKSGFFLLNVILISFTSSLWAQSDSAINLEIKLQSFSFNKVGNFFGDLLGSKVTPVYKFYKDVLDESHSLTGTTCYYVVAKDKSQVFTLSDKNTFGGPLLMRTAVDINKNKELTLLMENYENNKGEICLFDKGDAKHKISQYSINVTALKHGVTQQPITINSEQNLYSVVLTYRLGLPTLHTTICDSLSQYNNGTQPYTFKTNLNVVNKDGLQYEWQGSLDNKNWFSLSDKTIKEDITIIPERDIFKLPLKQATKCFIRYRLITAELTSDWKEQSFDVLPPAPIILKDNISTKPSCYAGTTGKITIHAIKGQTDQYRILLFKGNDEPNIHCFENNTKSCVEAFKDIVVNKTTAELNNIPAGNYKILISNANVASPFYQQQNVTVVEYPKLEITNYNSIQANCSINPTGSISIETKGGNPDSLSFLITPFAGELVKNDRKGAFNKLPEGKYNVLVKDACDQVLSTPLITIELKDDPLKGDITIFKKPDFNKNNGTVLIKLLNGSGSYSYKLFLQDNIMASKDFPGTELVVDSLYGAKYKIIVTDKNAPKCTGWSKEFLLEQLPPPPPPPPTPSVDTTQAGKSKGGADTLLKQ